VVVAHGFRLFLLSDIVLFSCLFAAHAVLQSATADGPAGHELFKPTNIAIETACLLLSADQLNPALVLVHASDIGRGNKLEPDPQNGSNTTPP
jgi:heme/copper-type cytochrome/quinol oxidase subunit 3